MDVDATLGADSIQKSLIAAAIGAIMIILFMVLYYRLSGLVACVALIMYTVLLLAIFKLIPITLTLPGVAAFIVSLGMAVDANVLIFERMKEEIRSGRTLGSAVETGFSRAWPAIRDSNVTTFIACIILYWFGSSMGAFMVSGFAITLFIGVALSMFSAITISRSILRLAIQITKSPSIYGVWK
jgi:preprotein translocase subunit SecD